MKLITEDDVRAYLVVDSIPEIMEPIKGAVHTATSFLASVLRTPDFGYGTYTDTFRVPAEPTDPTNNVWAFMLTRGLLTADGVTVKMADTLSDLSSNFTDVSGRVTINRTKGVVQWLYDDDPTSPYLQVTYKAGFNANAEDPDLYDPDEVPAWLQHAAKLRAVLALKNSPFFAALQTKGGELAMVNGDALARELSTIIEPYVRYMPSAVRPLTV